MNGTGPRAFISYSHSDQGVAHKLSEDLRKNGVDIWADFWDLNPGDSLVEKIFSEGIRDASFFLILLSPSSTSSEWVRHELDTGVVRRLEGLTRLIPVIIQSTDVPVALRSLQWVDLTSDYERGLRELVKVMHGVTEKPPLGPVPPFVTALKESVGGLSKEATAVGRVLLERPDDHTGFERSYVAKQLHDVVPALSVQEFNDAVDELESFGLVETIKTFGTAPYDFNELAPTYALFIHFTGAGLDYDANEDIRTVAAAVAAKNEITGPQLYELTKLPPARLNRAVAYLDAYRHVDVMRTMGTAPYDFNTIGATRRTRDFVNENCR
jgi:TIR domain